MARIEGSLWERRRSSRNRSLKIDAVAYNSFPTSCPEICDAYDVLEVLGRGTVGSVHRAVHRKDGAQVALKVAHLSDEVVTAVAKAEFAMLQRISHPNIVRALDFVMTRDHRAVLVLSFFDGKELGAAVRRLEQKRLQEATAQKLFGLLVRALEHLHQQGIIHCDVKPQNLMVSRDFTRLQLIDFNIALRQKEGHDLMPLCSQAYAAPEVLQGHSPTQVSDVWGAGLCLLTMLSGQCMRRSNDFILDIPMVSAQCRDTLLQTLAQDPSDRPTSTMLLQEEWLLSSPADEPPTGERDGVAWPSPTLETIDSLNRRGAESEASSTPSTQSDFAWDEDQFLSSEV